MKKLIVLSPLLFSTIATAMDSSADLQQIGTIEEAQAHYKMVQEWAKNHPGVAPPLTPEEEYAIFGKEGLPRPGTGVHIMPLEKMQYNKNQIDGIKANASTIKNKGYIEKYNQSAVDLLMFHQTAIKDFSNNHDLGVQSTHLRHNLSDLTMAYDYKGVPNTSVKEVIAFAPESTFIPNGWTGAIEFFSPQGFDGICSYGEVNIKLTGSAANFAKEIVSDDINSKITIIEASGNNASGYGYNIEWWDDNFRHVLKCANKVYSKSIKNTVVELAKQIDSSVSY